MFKNNYLYHVCELSRPPAKTTAMFKVLNSQVLYLVKDYENDVYTMLHSVFLAPYILF